MTARLLAIARRLLSSRRIACNSMYASLEIIRYRLLSARKRYHAPIPRVVHFSYPGLVHFYMPIDNGITRWFTSKPNNSLLEALNILLQAAKARARGCRSVENFTLMIYLIASCLGYLPA